MKRQKQFRVTAEDGVEGTMFATSRFFDENEFRLFRLNDGQEFLVPKELFQPQRDGSYHLPLSVQQLQNYSESEVHRKEPEPAEEVRQPHAEEVRQPQMIPAIQEELDISKRVVETGRVRIHKTVASVDSLIDEPLISEFYDIERSPVNRILSEPVEPRHEGDTLILPVLEEVLVVEKRLVLREEIRVTRKRVERRDPQTHTVRREHVDVERTG